MRRLTWIAAIAIVSAGSAAGVRAAEAFRAQGNEPAWSLRKTDAAITFSTLNGKALTVSPVPSPVTNGDVRTFKATVDGVDFALILTSGICNDTMSGMPFPLTVTVTHGVSRFSGCGGEPASLLQGAWRIVGIDGKAIVDRSEPTIAFAADGKVHGNGSCNRYFGGFTLSGEGLTLGGMGSSMMMCDDKLMAQEGLILAILKGTRRFSMQPGGALTLTSDDGRTITAVR